MSMHVLNRIVGTILQSPLHGVLSGSVLLVTYTGRISDRTFTVPVLYAGRNEELLVYVGHHERKHWWRNLRGGAPVHVRLRGADLAGSARVVDGEPTVRAGYLERFPRARRTIDADVHPVFVRITDLHRV
jgi:hypothetical protein